jgi:hypothetical protein
VLVRDLALRDEEPPVLLDDNDLCIMVLQFNGAQCVQEKESRWQPSMSMNQPPQDKGFCPFTSCLDCSFHFPVPIALYRLLLHF